MSDLIITSPSNPRLKNLIALRRRRSREESGRTLVEGYEELSLALDAGVLPRAVYYCPELMLDPGGAARRRVRRRGPRRGHHPAQPRRLREGGLPRGARRLPRGGAESVTRPAPTSSVGPDPLALLCQGVEKPGQPRRHAAHRRRRRGRRRRRRRPGDRLGQPQRRAREQGHRLLRAGRRRQHRRGARLAGGATASRWSRPPPTPTSLTPTSTTRGRWPSPWAPRRTGSRTRSSPRAAHRVRIPMAAGPTRSTSPRRPPS